MLHYNVKTPEMSAYLISNLGRNKCILNLQQGINFYAENFTRLSIINFRTIN